MTKISEATVCATDVSSQASVVRSGFRFNYRTGHFFEEVSILNTSSSAVAGPLSLVLDSLSANARLVNSSGSTSCAAPSGSPLLAIPIGPDNQLVPGETVRLALEFTDPSYQTISYTTRVLMGSNP